MSFLIGLCSFYSCLCSFCGEISCFHQISGYQLVQVPAGLVYFFFQSLGVDPSRALPIITITTATALFILATPVTNVRRAQISVFSTMALRDFQLAGYILGVVDFTLGL